MNGVTLSVSGNRESFLYPGTPWNGNFRDVTRGVLWCAGGSKKSNIFKWEKRGCINQPNEPFTQVSAASSLSPPQRQSLHLQPSMSSAFNVFTVTNTCSHPSPLRLFHNVVLTLENKHKCDHLTSPGIPREETQNQWKILEGAKLHIKVLELWERWQSSRCKSRQGADSTSKP